MVHAQKLHGTAADSSRGGLLEDWTDWCCSVSKLWDVDAKETFDFIKKHLQLSSYDLSTAEKAVDKIWKIRDAFVAVKNTMHQFMPRYCGKASVDEARIPCNGKTSCICALKSKPIKKGWTLWCAVVGHAIGVCFNVFTDGDSLCAETANHLAWEMTGETVLCIVREHKWVGV